MLRNAAGPIGLVAAITIPTAALMQYGNSVEISGRLSEKFDLLVSATSLSDPESDLTSKRKSNPGLFTVTERIDIADATGRHCSIVETQSHVFGETFIDPLITNNCKHEGLDL